MLLFSLFIYGFLPINVIGDEEQICTISTVADKDTYSDYNNPTNIMGGRQYLIAEWHNTSGEWSEYFPYIRFDLKDKPDNWTKAEIVLYYYDSVVSYWDGICADLVCVNITNNWEEETLNWDNQPSFSWDYRDEIGEFRICAPRSAEHLIKISLDISDHINYILNIEHKTEISISLRRPFTSTVFYGCKIRSREYSGSEKPTLVWTYVGHCPEPSPTISGYHLLALLLSLGVGLFIIRKGLKQFRILPKNCRYFD